MNNEFKKVKSGYDVHYVLETTSGATSSGSIASDDSAGFRHGIIVTREGNKKVETPKPRNFVAKNAKMGGAGKMKDKSKTIPRHEKHKKPVAEALGMENPDHESSMARNELYRNAKYGIAMLKMIEPGQQLEGWVESCLTKAASSLDKIYHYLDYETKFGQGVDHSEEEPEVDVEEDSGEADISRENLMLIVEYSIKLFKMIKDGDDLEGWVFMKLTKASECVSSAKHHLEYQQFKNHGLDDEYSDEETVAEGYGRYGRRDAYQRDYDASVAGMSGSRDDKFGYDDAGFSLRPGHDEGEPVYNPRYDRTRQYSSQPSTLYFYKVGPGDEQEARAVGLNQSKRGSWYSKGSRNAAADKRFGPGREVHMKEAANAAQQAAIAIAKKKEQGVAEGSEFGAYYYEQLAQQVFDTNPDLTDENEILNLGYKIAKGELGSRAQGMFRDEDFPSDFVSAYGYLKKQGVAEAGDTAKGQKMLAKVHQRAADRVTSKQADKDPAYARKAQQTQDRAWDRLAVKEQGVAEGEYTDHLADMLESVLAERSKSKAQWDLMHAVAHNPQFANQVKIDPSVGQEFAAADAGHERSALPDRVLKTKSKKK